MFADKFLILSFKAGSLVHINDALDEEANLTRREGRHQVEEGREGGRQRERDRERARSRERCSLPGSSDGMPET